MKELIFEELNFTNFKCHEEMSFSFVPNRFSVITGANGSGKTTIFDALCYALYDVTTKGIKGDSVIRRKSGKNLSVNLKFKFDNDSYEIQNYRKHYKYGDGKFLFLNGKDISGNSRKETNEKISQILMSQEVFTNCLLFSQFINKSFTELTHAGQKEILDRILGLEKYDELLELVNQAIKRYNSDIEKFEELILSHEKQLFSLQELVEQNKGYYHEIIKRYADEEEETKKEIQKLRNYINENQNHIELYLDKEKEQNQVKENLNSVLAEIDKQRQQCLLNLQACKNKFDKWFLERKNLVIKEIQDSNSSLTSKKNQLLSKIITIKEMIHNSRVDITKNIEDFKKKERERIEQSIKVLENNKERLGNKERQLQKEEQLISLRYEKNKKLLEECIVGLNQEVPVCSLCGQEIKDSKFLEHLQNEIDKLRIQIETDELGLSQRKLDLEKINDSKNDIEININSINKEYEEKIKEYSSNLESKFDDYVKKENENIELIQKQIAECEGKIDKNKKLQETKLGKLESLVKEKRNKEMETIKADAKEKAKEFLDKKETLERELERISKQLKDLEDIYLKVNNCKTTIDLKQQQLQSNREKMEIEIKNNENNILSLERRIKDKENEITSLRNNIQSKNRKNEILAFWKTAFSDTGIKSILLDEAIPILNERARELSNLTDCIKVSFDSQLTLKSGDMRDKFSINVLHTRNLSNFSELSAGETRMANIIVLLCLRHLMEAIQGIRINVLLLDEILDTLDQENAALAVGMIKKLTDTHCVILISHTLRNFIDADEELPL